MVSHVPMAFAQQSCDEDFRDVMNLNAWRTAKREIEAAERLILKADSVLEYSCLLDDFSSSGSASDWNTGVAPPPPAGGGGAPPYTGRSSATILAEYELASQEVTDLQDDLIELCRSAPKKTAENWVNKSCNQYTIDELRDVLLLDVGNDFQVMANCISDRGPTTKQCNNNGDTWCALKREEAQVECEALGEEELTKQYGEEETYSELVQMCWERGCRQFTIDELLTLNYQPESIDYEDAVVLRDDLYIELQAAYIGEAQGSTSANVYQDIDVAYDANGFDYSVGVITEHLDENFGGAFGGGTHNTSGGCIGMQVIWDFLKCRDFDIDDFRQFAEMPSADLRNYLPACNEANRTSNWTAANNAAEPIAGQSGGADSFNTYLLETSWFGNGACASIKPIPTGVIVIGDDAHEDKVCSLPMCYYDAGSDKCK